MPEHIGRQDNKSLSGVETWKVCRMQQKYFSSKENTDPQGKRTQIKHLLGWESLLSDRPEGRGRVYASPLGATSANEAS